MHYHARIKFGKEFHYWWNLSKHSLIERVLVPFVNGQVVVVDYYERKMILNTKASSLLNVYKTENPLEGRGIGKAPFDFLDKGFKQYDCTEEIIEQVKLASAGSAAQSVLQMAFARPKNQVFVIMKFGAKELDSAYEGVIKPIIEEYGFKSLRIDEVQDSGKITDQVLEEIASSKYVLADLSGERPNCYYETGFAHALGKQIILTIMKSDRIHFDLAGYRFIQWDTEAELRRELRKRFAELVRDGATDA
jgi:hypothetical protein